MTEKDLPIALPSVGEEEWLATKECFESGWLTSGPKVRAFEEAFAAYHKVKHAIAVSSCTTGLHLALLALGIGPGDEVIVPAFTWVATANVVVYCGATPVFCDIDPKTYNIDPKKAVEKITKRTKSIIPVHLFGLCADMDALRDALPSHVKIIEDAACAAGALYKDRYAGDLGDVGVFSFHPRKIITTGEGGMVTTNNSELAELINRLRNHGASLSEEQRHNGPKPYLLPGFDILGCNYRMTDMQGAVGVVQLAKLERFIDEREQLACAYDEALSGIDWIKTPSRPTRGSHSWQAYVCIVDSEKAPSPRNTLMEHLQSHGISTRPGTHSVPDLGYYRNKYPSSCPQASYCEQQTLALPLHNKMTVGDCMTVVDCLSSVPVGVC